MLYSFFIIILFIYNLLSIQSQHESIFSLGRAINITETLFDVAYDYIAWGTGLSGQCPFTHEIVQNLRDILPYYIQCQEVALESIFNVAASWEFKMRSGIHEPLVIAFTGPTGVGKSETAFRFAESVLLKRTRLGNSKRYKPNGLLSLRGEDYSTLIASDKSVFKEQNNATVIWNESISEVTNYILLLFIRKSLSNCSFFLFFVWSCLLFKMRNDIRKKIIQHLKLCQGNAIIVFDEVQKIVPGVLEVLLPMFSERGSVRDMNDVNNAEYSTTNCVFIFISDIAADAMIKLLLTHIDRASIPQAILRKEVKLALDQHWKQQGNILQA